LVHLRPRRIRHDNLEQKPIELRFRQWIGALLLDRVLRGHHKEWKRELVRCGRQPSRCAPALPSSRASGSWAWRGDFVGQHQLLEDRPGLEIKTALPVTGSSSHDLRAVMSEGMRSGVNWMRLNGRGSALPSVRTSSVLPRARHAFQQHVAIGEQRHQSQLHDLVLPDHGLATSARSRANTSRNAPPRLAHRFDVVKRQIDRREFRLRSHRDGCGSCPGGFGHLVRRSSIGRADRFDSPLLRLLLFAVASALLLLGRDAWPATAAMCSRLHPAAVPWVCRVVGAALSRACPAPFRHRYRSPWPSPARGFVTHLSIARHFRQLIVTDFFAGEVAWPLVRFHAATVSDDASLRRPMARRPNPRPTSDRSRCVATRHRTGTGTRR